MAVEIDANRRTIERYRDAVERGEMQELTELVDELAADDFVDEWPQSGERIRGRENMRRLNESYEGATGTSPKMKLREIRSEGNLAVIEGTIDYGDGTPVSYVGIAELENGKLRRLREYFANPFEAPEWRRKFVERMD
jgi:hypothetical protein